MRAPSQNHAAEMHAANRAHAQARVADYQWLRRELGMTREAARQRLRLSERTIWRYEARLRSGAVTRQEAA